MKKTRIDFTTFRKGSKPFRNQVIDYCPDCGKKGLKTFYPKGQVYMFTHEGYIQLGFLNITKSCTIKAASSQVSR